MELCDIDDLDNIPHRDPRRVGRKPIHVHDAANRAESDRPAGGVWQMFKHPLTDKGIEGFLKDWAASGQSIG